MDKTDFFTSLRQELVKTQELRFKLSFQKLIFIISLLGIGSVSIADSTTNNLKYLIYFVPFIAFMFDLYIIGENFGIRRIGNYIKFSKKGSKDEKYWEFLLNMPEDINRDRFAKHGNVYSTIIAIALSLFLVSVIDDFNSISMFFTWWLPKIIWLVLVIICTYLTWWYYPNWKDERLFLFKENLCEYSDKWKEILKAEKDILSSMKTFEIKEVEIRNLYFPQTDIVDNVNFENK